MSLHALATDMASKGRNGDSMLVHMTPGEVHGLQALAMKHGGSLTINPDTGLPEANFLKSLLPMLAGFALGPAGFGLVSSAMGAGAVVGGITGIATGSLSKGLMAGLGAYGGFGVGESLAGLGAGELAQGQISANMPTLAEGASQTQIADYAKQVNDLRTVGLQGASQLPMADKLSAGFSSASASPMDALNFAKDNKMALGMAAAPIIADQMVPTTTKAPTPMAPGRIREKRWDGRQFVDVANTDAGVFNTSGRSFSDPYRGYKGGGIVALAGGGTGVPTYFVENPDVAKAYTENTYGLTPEQFAYTHYEKHGKAEMTPDAQGNVARAPTTQSAGAAYAATHGIDLQKNIDNWVVNNPFATAADVTNALSGSGLTQADVNPYLTANTSISDAQRYALSHLNEIDGLSGLQKGVLTALARNPNMTQSEIDAAQAQYRLSDYDIQSPLIHGYQVANDQTAAAQAYLADPKNADVLAWINSDEGDKYLAAHPEFDLNDIAYTHFQRYGEDEGRKWGANVVKPPVVTPSVVTPPITYNTAGTNAPGGLEGMLGLPPGVSGAGITTVNPNGTITTRPNIPGIPAGGFTGMTDLRNAYTKGGGSLGYTSPVPTSLAAFNKTYGADRMGGDSLAAYNYLAGKGGATYPTKSGVGQISEDYATAVLGYPARGNLPYTYNKATGKMDPNPDYVAPGRNAAGDVTYSMSLNDIKSSLKETPLSGQALYDWAISNNLSAQQIADATGRSLSSVYADFRAGSKAAAKKKEDDKAAGINTLVEGGGDGNATTPGPDSASPANDAPGTTTAKTGGMMGYAVGGGLGSLGSYSDGGRLLKGPGDGVSDSIPATIGRKRQPARLADGEFVIPARIVSELGNGSTDAGAKKLYAMMDRVQRARGKTTGKNRVAANSRADKYLPA